MTSLEFDLLQLKYDKLAKSQKGATRAINESAMKSDSFSPGHGCSLHSILPLKIFRDKIFARAGKNVYLTFRPPLFIIQAGSSDTICSKPAKNAVHSK